LKFKPHLGFFFKPESVEATQTTVIKAPTGSGKTFAILNSAKDLANQGEIAVICFPNLNLLNENRKELEKSELGFIPPRSGKFWF
jgi:superfamily II DNA or RNA helicase